MSRGRVSHSSIPNISTALSSPKLKTAEKAQADRIRLKKRGRATVRIRFTGPPPKAEAAFERFSGSPLKP
jgi:hypothetical protein